MKTKLLAFIAGIIWLAAGFNVCRIGVVAWMNHGTTTAMMIVCSAITLLLFSRIFIRMVFRNVQRIRKIDVERRRVWHIMPVRSYIIMAFMITFGMLLRSVPAVPLSFIASFYVGLGAALMLAGTIYTSAFLCPKEL